MAPSHFEAEIEQLKFSLNEMAWLALSQLTKAKSAFLNYDLELAEEIMHNEARMNAFELSIDRDCENLLAIFTPVATDLRYIISVLKINSELERIADHAEAIVRYLGDLDKSITTDILGKASFEHMFDMAISMTHDIIKSLEDEDTTLARKVYKKDKELNNINIVSLGIISSWIAENPQKATEGMVLFSTIKKLERIGDHVKNIAEDVVFYLEAELLKSKKKSRRKQG